MTATNAKLLAHVLFTSYRVYATTGARQHQTVVAGTRVVVKHTMHQDRLLVETRDGRHFAMVMPAQVETK